MRIYIYGAGNNGKRTLELVKFFDELEVVGFIDRNFSNLNCIENIPIIGIEEAIMQGGKEELILVSPRINADIIKMLREKGFKQIIDMNSILKNVVIIPKKVKEGDYQCAKPFNHYDSPYADLEKLHREEDRIFLDDKDVKCINLNVEYQLDLLKKFSSFSLPDWENRNDKNRYYYNNSMFGRGSADALSYMMQFLKPSKIIEVGSGYSTAVMLDTNESYFEGRIRIKSIEPYPERLKSLIKKTDQLELQEEFLENIPTTIFEQLQENDILFIDSSHVSKVNSDVNYLFFEILPRLKRGVYIHFHDVFWPFEYPKEWVFSGRVYNELYMLRAFLMNNANYSIMLFGDMIRKRCANEIDPVMFGCGVGSIWLRKDL